MMHSFALRTIIVCSIWGISLEADDKHSLLTAKHPRKITSSSCSLVRQHTCSNLKLKLDNSRACTSILDDPYEGKFNQNLLAFQEMARRYHVKKTHGKG